MVQFGKAWRHVVISTLGSWLPGDPRGWRSRRHKRHSSGDYKNPPPAGEHASLHAYSEDQSEGVVIIPRDARAVVGRAIVEQLQADGHRVLCVSVGGVHAHALVELPDGMGTMRRIIGRVKCKSSRAIKDELPGRVWGSGGKFEQVRDKSHQRNVFWYILTKQGRGTWTWSYKHGERWV